MSDFVPDSMRYSIKVERPVQTQDTHTGEWVHTWETLSIRPASVTMSPSGDEGLHSDKVLAQIGVEFIIRYLSTLTEKCRIVFNGFNYQITSIMDEGIKHFQRITTIQQK
jgi:head-tail adaptor